MTPQRLNCDRLPLPQQLAEATPQRPGLEQDTRPIALSTQSCDWIRSLFPSLSVLKDLVTPLGTIVWTTAWRAHKSCLSGHTRSITMPVVGQEGLENLRGREVGDNL